jgi:hypothetical protein
MRDAMTSTNTHRSFHVTTTFRFTLPEEHTMYRLLQERPVRHVC